MMKYVNALNITFDAEKQKEMVEKEPPYYKTRVLLASILLGTFSVLVAGLYFYRFHSVVVI